MIIKATIIVPETGELGAIATDKTNNHVYITNEGLVVPHEVYAGKRQDVPALVIPNELN